MGIKYLRNFPWKLGEVSYDSSPIKHWSHLPIDYHSLRQCKITPICPNHSPYKMRLPKSLEFSTWQMHSNILECMWCLVFVFGDQWTPSHLHPNLYPKVRSTSTQTQSSTHRFHTKRTKNWNTWRIDVPSREPNIHIHIRPNNPEVRKIMDSKVPWLIGDMLVSFIGWYSFPEDKIRFSRKYLGIPVILVVVIRMNLHLPLPDFHCRKVHVAKRDKKSSKIATKHHHDQNHG